MIKRTLLIITMLAMLLTFTGCALLDFASCVADNQTQIEDIVGELNGEME